MNSQLKKLLMKLDIKTLKACIEKAGYVQEPYVDKEHIISSIVLANIPELNKMKFDNLENINKYYDYLDYINERRGFNEFNKLYKQLIKKNTIEIINFLRDLARNEVALSTDPIPKGSILGAALFALGLDKEYTLTDDSVKE